MEGTELYSLHKISCMSEINNRDYHLDSVASLSFFAYMVMKLCILHSLIHNVHQVKNIIIYELIVTTPTAIKVLMLVTSLLTNIYQV